MLVHVLNKDGKALMPCHPAKARILLRERKAKPVKGKTGYFTIQLLYGSSGYKQDIVVGIDTGAKRVPIAAVGNSRVYYAKEKILRTDVKKQLSDRARYRRTRRSRKTRYRKPRFLNRVKTKCARCGVNNVPKRWKKVKRKRGKSLKKVCNGRAQLCRPCQGKKGQPLAEGVGERSEHNKPHILAPSVFNRAESILNDVHKLSQTLPISRIVVEIASFDTQKMASALIEGVEYQHGTLFGYEIKQYLLTVHKHKCAYCGGLSGDNVLQVEHIHPQSKGGTDKVSNLTISCRVCNEAKGSLTLDQWERVLRSSPSEIEEKRLKNIPAIKKQSKLKKGFQYSALTQSYKNYLLSELVSILGFDTLPHFVPNPQPALLNPSRKDFVVEVTFGAKTKYHRNQLGLPKSQINDAFVIASEGKSFRMPKLYILEKQVKKRYPHDYISPHKKGQPIVKSKREPEIFGFRLWDKVKCKHSKNGEVVGYIQGRRSSGSFAIASLDGDLLIGGITYKKLTKLRKAESNYIRERIRQLFLSDFPNQTGYPCRKTVKNVYQKTF
ncbi:RRXRR domain-containing protein [bacterium]|nr:RRXRR domain-containing protein [bacterium]